jgi:predicted negative regulator of RcsB-dependent stress response
VVIAALGLFGINYKSTSTADAQLAASTIYTQLTDEIVDEDLADAEKLAGEIAANYADTPYLVQSKFAMARLYMDKNRDEDAANALRDILTMKNQAAVEPIARLRLAKILLYQDKPEDALATVEDSGGQAFSARFAEVRGDAYVALQDYDAARDAYTTALQDTTASQTIDQNYIRLKLYDLPVEAPVADASPDAEAPAEDVSQEPSNEEGGA